MVTCHSLSLKSTITNDPTGDNAQNYNRFNHHNFESNRKSILMRKIYFSLTFSVATEHDFGQIKMITILKYVRKITVTIFNSLKKLMF